VDLPQGKTVVGKNQIFVRRRVERLGLAGELEDVDQKLSVVEELVAGMNRVAGKNLSPDRVNQTHAILPFRISFDS
jgi:hypothetical protein